MYKIFQFLEISKTEFWKTSNFFLNFIISMYGVLDIRKKLLKTPDL
jgi:hypothetical protein